MGKVRRQKAAHPAQGWRLPAEWEPHEATWLAWPHHTRDWPGKFGAIQWVYGEIVRKLGPGERVRIMVNSRDHRTRGQRIVTRAGGDLSRVDWVQIPTNRGWTRDSGPLFLQRVGAHPVGAIARFRFNAWARYPDWRRDDAVPLRVAAKLKMPLVRISHAGRDVVLEGGSIDVNGLGALVTTEECLLDPAVQTRNPGFTRSDYESIFRRYLGVQSVIWLGRGIAGDDTHGHVDDLCRFVGPRTMVLCRERQEEDENYHVLRENRERLETARLQDGSKPEVVLLPMPEPLYFEGRRLPASYANFYIANEVVLVPTFNDLQDRVALGILGEVFPDRRVVGIHAVDLVWGLGTVHCLTQQQPALTGHERTRQMIPTCMSQP